MLHDIDYLRTAGQPDLQNIKDYAAIKNSDNSLAGIATKAGLTMRSILGLTFNNAISGVSAERTRVIGNQLMDYIMYNEPYRSLFKKYSVSKNDYF